MTQPHRAEGTQANPACLRLGHRPHHLPVKGCFSHVCVACSPSPVISPPSFLVGGLCLGFQRQLFLEVAVGGVGRES